MPLRHPCHMPQIHVLRAPAGARGKRHGGKSKKLREGQDAGGVSCAAHEAEAPRPNLTRDPRAEASQEHGAGRAAEGSSRPRSTPKTGPCSGSSRAPRDDPAPPAGP